MPGLAAETDGILEVLARGDSWVEIAIWNPDGSRAEMSGNGTRIAARWLAELTGATEVRVRVGPREIVARLAGSEVEQELGQVHVAESERIAGLDVIAVDVGNPHAVVIGDPDDLPLIGPLLETHPRFPNRTNVQVARIDGPGRVTARVWERGVGETQSSGTSAVAVAAATHGDGDVLVHFPGGDLRVRLEGGRAWLTGPALRLRVPRQVLVYLHRRTADGGREFLMLRRIPEHDGFWQGVSGAPEWGEPDDTAAVREVREETGLEVSERLMPVGYRYELRKAEVEGWAAAVWERLYGLGVETVPEEVYAAEASADWEPTLAPSEHDAHRWCTLDEALDLLKFEENREALRRAAEIFGD